MRKKLKKIWGSIRLSYCKSTGMERDACVFFGSKNISVVRKTWLELPYDLPESVWPISDQMHRRDNGKCLHRGLEQSFYVFSNEGRHQLYGLGLEELSSEPDFWVFPPPKEFRNRIYEQHYKRRFPKWKQLFESQGIQPPKSVLVLRCYYGQILEDLRNWGSSVIWAKDMTKNCERWVNQEMAFVKIPEGGLHGRIEMDSKNVASKFDLIVCFHTLTHSVDFVSDLEYLRTILSPGGGIIFCDEITKKPRNPFHMVHFDERVFVDILNSQFHRVCRIDGSGSQSVHITPYTLKGDNPDIVAFTKDV